MTITIAYSRNICAIESALKSFQVKDPISNYVFDIAEKVMQPSHLNILTLCLNGSSIEIVQTVVKITLQLKFTLAQCIDSASLFKA